MVKTKKRKKVADIETIIGLIKQAEISIHRIETDLKISKSTVLRAIKPNTDRPLPAHWEIPILKYLRKKITEKGDAEKDHSEILIELGFKPKEKETGLSDEEKSVKNDWFNKLQL